MTAIAMTMPASRRAQALPHNLPPRGLSRVEAAAYIGISPGCFDELVRDGLMPQAKQLRGRRIWDREALDKYFAALPDSGAANPWD